MTEGPSDDGQRSSGGLHRLAAGSAYRTARKDGGFTMKLPFRLIFAVSCSVFC
jgi:hypothetical protein